MRLHLTWPDSIVKSMDSASWLGVVVTVIPGIISCCCYDLWHLISLEEKMVVLNAEVHTNSMDSGVERRQEHDSFIYCVVGFALNYNLSRIIVIFLF